MQVGTSTGIGARKCDKFRGELVKTCTRKQVLLLKTLSKQLNAISMGLLKQKSSPRNDSYKI